MIVELPLQSSYYSAMNKNSLWHVRVELDSSVNGLHGVHLGGAQASFRSDVGTKFVRDLSRLKKSRRVANRRGLGKIDVVVLGQYRLYVRVKLNAT